MLVRGCNDLHYPRKVQEETIEGRRRHHRQARFRSSESGAKLIGSFWTLGRYDSVFIWEGADEGAVQRMMKACLGTQDFGATETLVGIKRDEALKLLDRASAVPFFQLTRSKAGVGGPDVRTNH
jgi:uncharacterized protein with GYD domain